MRCCAMGRRLVLDEAATLAFDPVDRLVKGSWCSGRRAMTTIAGPAPRAALTVRHMDRGSDRRKRYELPAPT